MTKKIIITDLKDANHTLYLAVREESHRHYGGRIYPSDFNTDYPGNAHTSGSPIAARIASDFKWEQDFIAGKEERKWKKHNSRL